MPIPPQDLSNNFTASSQGRKSSLESDGASRKSSADSLATQSSSHDILLRADEKPSALTPIIANHLQQEDNKENRMATKSFTSSDHIRSANTGGLTTAFLLQNENSQKINEVGSLKHSSLESRIEYFLMKDYNFQCQRCFIYC